MDLDFVFSQSRLDKILDEVKELYNKEDKKSLKMLAYRLEEALDELSKQLVILSLEHCNLRMKIIKMFVETVSKMTFKEFILNFPRNDGGDYTNIEAMYKKHINNLSINEPIGESASILIGEMDVNRTLNRFTDNVNKFRIERTTMFFGDGDVNPYYSEHRYRITKTKRNELYEN